MVQQDERCDNIEATIDSILQELNEAGGKLPKEAIRQARAHRDHVIPRLIQAIEDATERAKLGDVGAGHAHFIALFLLAEFRAMEALPAIISSISQPEDIAYELYGDAVGETLPRVLAALAPDDLNQLEELIRNRSLDTNVRWSTADAYFYLVRDGRLTRDDAVDRLRRHLRAAIAEEEIDLIFGLIIALLPYSPCEALDEIEEAFRRNLVEEFMVNMEDVQRSISEGDEGYQKELSRLKPTGIPDTIEELETWAVFTERPAPAKSNAPAAYNTSAAITSLPSTSKAAQSFQPITEVPAPRPSTVRHTDQRVGRNDPCPCGSGRKFKKCCGAR